MTKAKCVSSQKLNTLTVPTKESRRVDKRLQYRKKHTPMIQKKMQTEFETKEDIFSRNEPGDLDSINERNKEKLRAIRNNQKAKRSYQKKIHSIPEGRFKRFLKCLKKINWKKLHNILNEINHDEITFENFDDTSLLGEYLKLYSNNIFFVTHSSGNHRAWRGLESYLSTVTINGVKCKIPQPHCGSHFANATFVGYVIHFDLDLQTIVHNSETWNDNPTMKYVGKKGLHQMR